LRIQNTKHIACVEFVNINLNIRDVDRNAVEYMRRREVHIRAGIEQALGINT